MIGLASDEVGGSGDVQKVTAELDGFVLTNPVEFVSSWAEFNDLNSGVNSVDIRSYSQILAGAGQVDIVGSPAAGRQRQVKAISFYNNDTLPATVTVYIYSDSVGNNSRHIRVTLNPGDQLHFIDTRGWYVIDANGNTKVIEGNSVVQQTKTRNILSGSTSGRPIAVAATATPGTLIHTASLADFDEIWLWVNNRTGTAATLTLEFGGTTNADQIAQALSIPANSSSILVIQGLILTGGVVLRAFSGTANALNVVGYINRIS